MPYWWARSQQRFHRVSLDPGINRLEVKLDEPPCFHEWDSASAGHGDQFELKIAYAQMLLIKHILW